MQDIWDKIVLVQFVGLIGNIVIFCSIFLRLCKLQKHMKLAFPSTNSQLSFQVQGIFATPQEWKNTDDTNPGLFTYSLRFLKFEFEKGKIYPKELTAKQLRQQDDKNKKGGKKDSKKEQGNAEQQKIKKQEEEDEKKREEQWSSLPLADQQYRPYEDTFKSSQLRFENGLKQQKFIGKQFVVLEERLGEDHGEWVYVYKLPAVSEDELAKMRKAKPKTLNNINDLNPIVMRAWVDLTPLSVTDCKTVTQRCKLIQIDQTPETSVPNLQNTYVKVTLTLQQNWKVAGDGVEGSGLIANPPEGEIVSDRVRCVGELREQLRLAIQSLAMQYSTMFWKELNIYQDFKNLNPFINKKNEITKRKQHFLYDFNVSGKYKILKDRIKKTIVHLCQKYFVEQMAGVKSFTGISCSIKDQFYSQIYNFLVAKYKLTLQQLIFQKKQNLKQIQVLSQTAQHKNIQKLLNSNCKQTSAQRVKRIIDEYSCLGNFQYGQQLYRKYIQVQPNNVQIKYSYSMYCIKNRLKKAEEILPFVEDYLSFNKNDQNGRMEYLLLLIASQNQSNCRKAWVLLRETIQQNTNDSQHLYLASFIFKEFLNSEQIAEKYAALAERACLRSEGKIASKGKHKQAPTLSELPTLKGLPSYMESLSSQLKDKQWIAILNIFQSLNLTNIVQKIQTKISNTSNSLFDVLKLKGLLIEGLNEQFQKQSKQLFQKTRAEQILQLLVNYYLSKQSKQAQKYLKLWLVKAKGQQQWSVMLKLSNYYLKNTEYGNARACILKYLQKKPINSGCSWRILGICQFNSGNLELALQCLRKANLADINNSENWLWLTKIYAQKQNFVMCNQCLNQYEFMAGKQISNPEYSAILTTLREGTSSNLCEQKLRVQLVERLEPVEAN